MFPPHLSPLPEKVRIPCLKIFRDVAAAGGRALLVGGWVRDALLGKPSKDLDIEVFGLEVDRLEALLKRSFDVIEVGKAFGVFKINGLPIDISLPRRESKIGLGHKAFKVEGDPYLSFQEAALRRDFTVNAISLDLLREEMIDPCGGCKDLEQGLLRHAGKQFAEDPLRVLRAMQFIARFELKLAPETLQVCRSISKEGLPPERIFEEWKKLLLKGTKPSMGLQFLRECGWVRYYPELKALIGCEQDPEWHPEGDVWTHTLHCLDAFAKKRLNNDWEDLVVGFAILCHDLGKPATTRFEDGHIRSRGHEAAGEGPTRSLMARMSKHKELIESVVPLVITHLRPRELYLDRSGDAAIRRLARKVQRIDRLVRVVEADLAGRPPIPDTGCPECQWLLEKSEALAVKDSVPRPIILGRHLIQLGQQPGPHFKKILDHCYEAQLDGKFETVENGINFAKQLLEPDST